MHRKEKLARVQRLTRASTGARQVLARDVAILRHQLDLPRRMKRSLRINPMPWLGGSAVLGLITSRLFKRRRKSRREDASPDASAAKKGGFLVTLLGLAYAALRPLAQKWATRRLKLYLGHRMRYGSTSNPRGTNFRPSNPL